MPRTLGTLILFFLALITWACASNSPTSTRLPNAAAPAVGTCANYLRAFNNYQELIKGKVVNKFSVFKLGEWSSDSGFQGIVATSEVPQDALMLVEVLDSNNRSVLVTSEIGFIKWDRDPAFRVANFKAVKFFREVPANGFYKVSISSTNSAFKCEPSQFPMTVTGD